MTRGRFSSRGSQSRSSTLAPDCQPFRQEQAESERRPRDSPRRKGRDCADRSRSPARCPRRARWHPRGPTSSSITACEDEPHICRRSRLDPRDPRQPPPASAGTPWCAQSIKHCSISTTSIAVDASRAESAATVWPKPKPADQRLGARDRSAAASSPSRRFRASYRCCPWRTRR